MNKLGSIFGFLPILLLTDIPLAFSQPSWEKTNGPYGGDARLICILSHKVFVVKAGPSIFCSDDRGESWYSVSCPPIGFIHSLRSSPDGYLYALGDYTLFRSSDYGNTWFQLKIADQRIIYIAIGPSGELVALSNNVLYRSDDHGERWKSLNIESPYISTSGIEIDPGGTIYVWAANNLILKRLNPGASSWENVEIPYKLFTVGKIAFGRNNLLYVSTTNAGICRSTNKGATWSIINVGLPSEIIRSFEVLPSGVLLAGVAPPKPDQNLFRSTNNGNSWSPVEGVTSTFATQSIAIDSSGIVFAANGALGILVSRDEGTTWKQAPISFSYPISVVASPSAVFVSLAGQGTFTSVTGGTTWSQISTRTGLLLKSDGKGSIYGTDGFGLMRYDITERSWVGLWSVSLGHMSPVEIASNGDLFIGFYGGFKGDGLGWAMRSTDRGTTWSTFPIDADFYRFVADPTGFLYAYTNFGVYLVTNGNSGWYLVDVPELSNILVLRNGSRIAGSPMGIQIMNNDGRSWGLLGLFGYRIHTLLFNRTGHLFAATPSGMFRSTDDGKSWQSMNDGLPKLNILDAALDSTGILYAAVAEGGIYKTRNSTVTSVSESMEFIPHQFFVHQNYPNPFNGQTTISFTLSKPEHVTVRVYDLLGREQAHLLSREMDAGTHTVPWDAFRQPSGMYFYRVQAGEQMVLRKLTIIR